MKPAGSLFFGVGFAFEKGKWPDEKLHVGGQRDAGTNLAKIISHHRQSARITYLNPLVFESPKENGHEPFP
jgi:hypothetical protein